MQTAAESAKDYRGRFKNYYYGIILSKLSAMEEKRSSALVWFSLCFYLLALTVIITIFCLNYYSKIYPTGFWDEGGLGDTIINLSFFACSLFVFLAYKVKKNFENEVKKGMMDAFLSFFGNFLWSCKDSISKIEIEDSKLVDKFTKMKHDDYFSGEHRGLSVEISEVELTWGSGRNSNTIFNGIFVKLGMNKKFNSHTIIVEDNPVKGFFAKSFQTDMQKVELEDVEFEKEFDVYGQDQVEARYLITAGFIERFKNLKEVYKTTNIKAAFLDNSIIIAIPCKRDMFRLGALTKPVSDTGQIQELFDEFVAVLSLVDLLDLEAKTGL